MDLIIVFLVWVVGFGGLSIAVRGRLGRAMRGWPVWPIVAYFALVVPIVLVEEALTVEEPYFPFVFQVTLPAFCIMFLGLYALQRLLRFNEWVAAGLFGVWGWVNEFLLVGRIGHPSMEGAVLVVMSVLCVLIYAVMALLPAAVLRIRLATER
jgi:hypothetical protein